MLAKETTPKNLKSTEPRMKDGEEPTEVLLALASSPMLTLKSRGLVKVLTAKGENGKPVVLAVFDNALWDHSVGLISAEGLPTVGESVGSDEK